MEQLTAQKILSSEQVEAFYHDVFVDDQVRDFVNLVDSASNSDVPVLDVGGGCGFFAKQLSQLTAHPVRVMDMDPTSVNACRAAGVQAERGDALNPDVTLAAGGLVCFNLILHHLIGASESETLKLQNRALTVWRADAKYVFVNEYIYESYVGNMSGWLIYQITKSQVLSWIGRKVATVIPAFRANTFGTGVRFRAHDEWKQLFAAAGYVVESAVIGQSEKVSKPLRLLLIKTIRRDSFLLTPIGKPCA